MLPPNRLNSHVIDVHCHPTDTTVSPEAMDALEITICAMSSRQEDQPLVRSLALSHPDKVVPCFGYHPWFTHRISLKPAIQKQDHYRSLFTPRNDDETRALDELMGLLPEPINLEDILGDLRRNLEDFPVAMLGEVGLDRSFRVAYDYFASPRKLTPFTIPIEHQLAILHAQIDIAVELGRNVSLHSVKAQQATMELLSDLKIKHGKRWDGISLDMHSCGFSPPMWKDIQKKYSNIYLSLSTVINSRSPNHMALIEACAPDRILVESDFNDVAMCTERTWEMLRIVADVKGWSLETEWLDEVNESDEAEWGVVRRLEKNWRAFKAGNHAPVGTLSRKEKREMQDWMSDSSGD
ncbi:Cut9-interacting protein scn1 [Marasmius tenuissimus]|uniref:Cut9-interacting protein scn1 n=1 Tax=Marasmius tenuissimus TaxID=585030 RepID=A0ABR3A4P7_9AGAR|nr:Cut9-interacting protein scn1 [Marasmius tenuissimus]